MKVNIEHDGTFLPIDILNKTTDIIKDSLQLITTTGSEFIINDTLYFRKQRTGKTTNCVMNSALYLSKKFQQNLQNTAGCEGETKISGQNIDGFIEHEIIGHGYLIKDKNLLLQVLHAYIEDNKLPPRSIYTLFPMFYGMYVEKGLYDIRNIPKRMHNFFEKIELNTTFRVGVEFETGNVASSFRALNKLFVLFQEGEIDAGVFVTSVDKPTSASRIWPVSNRNGSFQELKQRRYMDQVSLPLICIGFAPDKFTSEAPFLGKNGSTYFPTKTSTVDESGKFQILAGEDGEEILKPLVQIPLPQSV
jgi:hypothetical protein